MRRAARHRRAVLAAGAAAALAGWLATGTNAPPLYDSVGVAPPFRYVCAPAGINLSLHPAPNPATQTLPVTNGQSPGVGFTTDEVPIPQAQVLVQAGELVLPPGATAITVSLTPVVPPQILPSDGVLDGNVYDIPVTAGNVALPLAPGALATVVLRGPPTGKLATLEQFDGRTWTPLNSTPVGTADIFGANVTSFTTFALVLPGSPQTHAAAGCLPGTTLVAPGVSSSGSATSTASAGAGGESSNTALILIGVAVVALLVAGGLLLLLRSSGRPPPRSGGGRGRPSRRR
ncbi:MAG TPA: hypothetical protein VI316_04265 [Candidatus Dormibacteraeota bacterium]